jgi:serine/threonine protein kinase
MSDPQTIGRYQITAELGHGAMGSVYKAVDPMMDRTVAIKTILAAALTGPLAKEYRERFIREARAAGRLTHPGIVTVYDVGEQEGMPYLVMEYVPGRSLGDAMEAGERFTFERIYELGHQLADAIGYAHRNGVVHRDIKPANILLAPGGPNEPEHAKIADLGVAKLTASQITTTGQLLGTPAFMPPEQFTGAPLDGRADLFSLGVIMYWLATGDKPFAGDTITAVSYKIVHSEPAPPRRINPACPVALERIILKCLEKDPATRYGTGEALAADLDAARQGRDVVQQTVTPAQRTAVATVLAPVATMSGDPNTTLDSDARLHMSEVAPANASPVAAPAAQAAASQKKPAQLSTPQLITAAAAVGVLLLATVVTYGVVRHRRHVRAEQEAAAAAAQAAEAQQQALAKAQEEAAAAQAAQIDAAAQAPDQNGQGGQPADNSTAAKPNNSNSASAAAAKKTTPKNQPKSSASGTTAANSQTMANTAPATAPPTAPPPPAPATTGTPNNVPPATAPAAKPAATPASSGTSAAAAAPDASAPAGEPAKLHIDDGHVPNAAGYVVLMDGKQFFERKATPEGEPPKIEDQSVPPGDHDFQVITEAGAVQIAASNSVKEKFQAKKRMTLHIELRDNSNGQTLKKSSHIDAGATSFVISLKAAGLLPF